MNDEIKDIMERLYKQGFADGVAAAKRGDTAMDTSLGTPVFAQDAQNARAAYLARFPNAGRLGVLSGFASAPVKKPPPMTAESLASFRERFPNSGRLKA